MLSHTLDAPKGYANGSMGCDTRLLSRQVTGFHWVSDRENAIAIVRGVHQPQEWSELGITRAYSVAGPGCN